MLGQALGLKAKHFGLGPALGYFLALNINFIIRTRSVLLTQDSRVPASFARPSRVSFQLPALFTNCLLYTSPSPRD